MIIVDLLCEHVVAVGDELVPGLKEAEELDGAVAFPLDHRVVLHHHCVRVHPLEFVFETKSESLGIFDLLFSLNATLGGRRVFKEESERCLRTSVASRFALSVKKNGEYLIYQNIAFFWSFV